MSDGAGTVYSRTTIRVPGNAQAAEAPFVLLLVTGDDGVRRLGRFRGECAPEIGTHVAVAAAVDGVPIFEPAGEDR